MACAVLRLYPFITGDCITSIFRGEVCDLNSSSVTCNELRVERCLRNLGVQSSKCSSIDGKLE